MQSERTEGQPLTPGKSHLGERSSIKRKEEQELEHARGDSVVVLPPLAKESEEELTLLVLPSRISEDKLGRNRK